MTERAHQNILEIKGLSKHFRSYWKFSRIRAVEDLSLSVGKGDVFGFLGRNGAGKTTTIKCILGLIHKNSGQILLNGSPLKDPGQRALMGYLPEQPYFYEHLSVQETLEFFAGLFAYSPQESKRRVSEALVRTGLESRKGQRIRGLSKGLQQRLAVAQAILNSPQLLILDEPFSGLDPVGRKEMRDLFTDLNQAGTTLFLSSHILADIEGLCDRICILRQGQLAANYSKDQLSQMQLSSCILKVAVENPSDLPEELKQTGLVNESRNGLAVIKYETIPEGQKALGICLDAGLQIREFRHETPSLEELFFKHSESYSSPSKDSGAR